jgi:hypothetical protein
MNERTGEEHPAFRGRLLRELAGRLALGDSAIREWEAGRTGRRPVVSGQAEKRSGRERGRPVSDVLGGRRVAGGYDVLVRIAEGLGIPPHAGPSTRRTEKPPTGPERPAPAAMPTAREHPPTEGVAGCPRFHCGLAGRSARCGRREREGPVCHPFDKFRIEWSQSGRLAARR